MREQRSFFGAWGATSFLRGVFDCQRERVFHGKTDILPAEVGGIFAVGEVFPLPSGRDI